MKGGLREGTNDQTCQNAYYCHLWHVIFRNSLIIFNKKCFFLQFKRFLKALSHAITHVAKTFSSNISEYQKRLLDPLASEWSEPPKDKLKLCIFQSGMLDLFITEKSVRWECIIKSIQSGKLVQIASVLFKIEKLN